MRITRTQCKQEIHREISSLLFYFFILFGFVMQNFLCERQPLESINFCFVDSGRSYVDWIKMYTNGGTFSAAHTTKTWFSSSYISFFICHLYTHCSKLLNSRSIVIHKCRHVHSYRGFRNTCKIESTFNFC